MAKRTKRWMLSQFYVDGYLYTAGGKTFRVSVLDELTATGDRAVTAADDGYLICVPVAATIALPDAATLSPRFFVAIENTGVDAVAIPALNLTLSAGQDVCVYRSGESYATVPYHATVQSPVCNAYAANVRFPASPAAGGWALVQVECDPQQVEAAKLDSRVVLCPYLWAMSPLPQAVVDAYISQGAVAGMTLNALLALLAETEPLWGLDWD